MICCLGWFCKDFLSFQGFSGFQGLSFFSFILCQRALPPRRGCRWKKHGNSLEKPGLVEPQNFAIWVWPQQFWHALRSDVCNWHQVHAENMTLIRCQKSSLSPFFVQVAVPKVLTHGRSVDPRQFKDKGYIQNISGWSPISCALSKPFSFQVYKPLMTLLLRRGDSYTADKVSAVGLCSHGDETIPRRIWEKLQNTPMVQTLFDVANPLNFKPTQWG